MLVRKPSPLFGYKSELKTRFLRGELPEVKYGFYGGKLTNENVSLEHIQARSRGGASSIHNYALATKKTNNARGNIPFKKYIKDNPRFNKTIDRYLGQFDDELIIAGVKYKQKIIETLFRLMKR
jgi:endonuclease I